MANRNLADFNEAQYQIKIKHFFDKGMDVKGVVHVGSNDGYEVQWYMKVGINHVLCFEPLPKAVERFEEKYAYEIRQGKVKIFDFGLGEKNKRVPLHIAPADGQGSSILLPQGKFKTMSPHRDLIDASLGDVDVDIKTFETFMEENPDIDISLYDCLVIDTQGTELDVLKGFGKYLNNFTMLNIECSEEAVYEGEATAQEVINYLSKHGFKQDSPIEPHNDIMFIRS